MKRSTERDLIHGDDDNAAGRADWSDGASSPALDEGAFLKAARRRSVRRTVLVSVAVLAVALAAALGGFISWNRALYGHMNRIDSYYPTLVSISSPNTELLAPSITRPSFPGRVNEYAAYRRVGETAVPAGSAFVEFDVWGGEQVRGVAERWVRTSSRSLVGAALVPELQLFVPGDPEASLPADPGQAADLTDWGALTLDEMASHTDVSLARLAAAPASATVEAAISFKAPLTLGEVQRLIGDDLDLLWGAVIAGQRQAVPTQAGYGHMVGVDFARDGGAGLASPETNQQAEASLTDELEMIADFAPEGTATRCLASAAYLKAHGMRYFAIVVSGPTSAVRALAAAPGVTATSVGLIVMPWE